ncbi:hypothetical protein ACFE04_012054 [Oxalis oulophora]
MASLVAHFTAFLFLFPTGLRRLFHSSSLYLTNPSHFLSKPFFFTSSPRYKNLDLYILSIALPIASFSEFFIFITITDHHPSYKFSFIQQSVSLFLFWVLLILFICRESFDLYAAYVNDVFLFSLAAFCFFIECSVIGVGITGLGGIVYDLLRLLTLVCAGCCVVLSIRPTSFYADFVLGCGLVFKGTWVLQAGLNLYTDAMAFNGCRKVMVPRYEASAADVKCELEEDGLRGMALINLLFLIHAIVVLVLGFVVYGLLSIYRNLRCCSDASGPLLAQLESDSTLMRPVHFDVEIE